MDATFTDEQMVTLLTWLEDKRNDGYSLDDIIAELTHTSGRSTIKDLSQQDQDLSNVSQAVSLLLRSRSNKTTET